MDDRHELHKHKCENPECGHIWEHRASDFNGHDEYRVGHTCAQCGQEQYFKEFTPEERAKQARERTILLDILFG